MDTSQFRIISLGIVAEDKEIDSRYIEVYPMELLPFIEGGISSEIFIIDREGIHINKVPYNVSLHRTMTVKADWIGSTHRVTSPNVKKGEQVKLWRIGDGERYYWEPLGRDDIQRTRERITWAFASREKGNKELTSNDTYSLTIDTIDKHVTFNTSKSDGEFCRYSLQINTGDGNVTLNDDIGNVFQIDSKNTKITALNKDGTFLTLNKKDIEMYAPNDLIAAIDHNVSIIVGNDWIESVGNNKIVEIGNDYSRIVGGNETTTIDGDNTISIVGSKTEDIGGDDSLTVGGSLTETITADKTTSAINVTTNATNITETATAISLTAATIGLTGATTITGMVAIAGPLTMAPGGSGGGAELTGDMTINGDSTMNGNMTQNGDLTVSGQLTCSNLITPTWNGIPQADHLKDT